MDYESWLDEVADKLFALLGTTLDDYEDVNYLDYYAQGYDSEAVVREIYESE